MAASQNGHINVVKILHVYHANVNAKDLVRLFKDAFRILCGGEGRGGGDSHMGP